MNTYTIALFFHIVGALVLFAALSLEWAGLRQIRNAASSDQVRAWLGSLKSANKAGFLSMLATVVTGVYMMVSVWGQAPWLVTTIMALVLMIALARVAAPRLKALAQAEGRAVSPLLWISIQIRVAIVLGIIFLKIAKPNLGGSLLTIGIAIILGIASASLMSRRYAQAQLASTD